MITVTGNMEIDVDKLTFSGLVIDRSDGDELACRIYEAFVEAYGASLENAIISPMNRK